MLPEWAQVWGSWCVVVCGLAVIACLAVALLAAVIIGAVLLVEQVREAEFRSDFNAGARYLLWKVCRDARRGTDRMWFTNTVPSEVRTWAEKTVADFYARRW